MSRSFSCPGPPGSWRRSDPAGPAFAPGHQGTGSASPCEFLAPQPMWRPSVPPPGPNTKLRASLLSSLCVLVAGLQYHRDVIKTEHIALIGNFQPLGVEVPVEQFYPDRGLGHHRTLAHIHKRVAETRFVPGRGYKVDVIVEGEHV